MRLIEYLRSTRFLEATRSRRIYLNQGSLLGDAAAPIDGHHGVTGHLKRAKQQQEAPEHRMFPCLLKNLPITRLNQVWCSDITYIPVENVFLYLVAIMDWATRKVSAWRLSNTLDVSFCIEALEKAIAKYGKPRSRIRIRDANIQALAGSRR